MPGCHAFVIGFPQGLSSGFNLPIWKATHIASEPFYDVGIGGKADPSGVIQGELKVPAFFLDGLTRSGMSGSPVFASYTGNWSLEDPYEKLDYDHPDFWSRDDVGSCPGWWCSSAVAMMPGCAPSTAL
jgi:hypothetical protein